jgi:hypothetical protein
MAIPSLIKWRTKTFVFGYRSPEMGIIDDKIREYWQALDREGKNQAAYGIHKACRHWLKLHAGDVKNGNQKAVEELEGEAQTELKHFQPGWSQFAAKKTLGSSHNLKGLAPFYAHERRMYEGLGKRENPASASAVRDGILDSHIDEFHNAQERDQLWDRLITTVDDATWDGFVGPGAVGGDTASKVLFFDKRARLEHMLIALGGRLIWAKNNQLFDTPDAAFMYAMDRYGNLFAKSSRMMGDLYFNHSSFNAGREVICAGMIHGTGGELDCISNESGHYQPTRADLFSCVKKLRDDGVKMDFGTLGRTRVRAMGAGDWPAIGYGNTPGFTEVAAALSGRPPAPSSKNYDRWREH